jgi:hypothetical protein
VGGGSLALGLSLGRRRAADSRAATRATAPGCSPSSAVTTGVVNAPDGGVGSGCSSARLAEAAGSWRGASVGIELDVHGRRASQRRDLLGLIL